MRNMQNMQKSLCINRKGQPSSDYPLYIGSNANQQKILMQKTLSYICIITAYTPLQIHTHRFLPCSPIFRQSLITYR